MNMFVTPTLIGGINGVAPYSANTDVDRLVREFGSTWKKTPHQGVWHIAKPGVQVTIDHNDGMKFYECPTVTDFRKGFETEVLRVVSTRQVDTFYKYTGLQVIDVLKALGKW